jgi:small conductance mechanosensitive channel
MLTRGWDTFLDMAALYGLRVLGAIVIITIGYFAARMVKTALLRAGRRAPHVDMTIVSFVASLAKYGILAFTLVAVLSNFGVQTASVVAVIGAAGLAIGLALQGTLGHVASGFMLILFRPFRVGDAVETAGVSGIVTEVSLFTTEINSFDNVRIVIPNSQVWAGVTKNMSSNQTRRSDLEVIVSPESNVDEALKIIQQLVAEDARILKQPPPIIGAARVTEAGVRLIFQVWSKASDMLPVQFALNQKVIRALGDAGIALAQPARQPPRR